MIFFSTATMLETRTVLGWRRPAVFQCFSGWSPVLGFVKKRGWLLMGHTMRSGSFLWKLSALTTRAADLRLTDRIRILAGIAHGDMPDYLALADVVVSIPETDGTPVTLLEAMATGRPIVASDTPSVRALLGSFDAGALVPVGDAPATALAIATRLAWTPEQQRTAGQRARAIIVTMADQDANMRTVEGLYARLVGGRREARRQARRQAR